MKAINESELWKKRLGDWVLNPYVGCEHGCLHCYCPAMPGVKFHNEGHTPDEWGKYLIAKQGFVDAVKNQLRNFTPDKAKRTDWGDGWLLMSFLTDCYTPSEAKLMTTRETLKLLLEAGHKVRVLTRSALAERDFDILRAHKDRVLFGTSLPYQDDALARVLEPKATGPTRRLKMLQNAADAGLTIFCSVAPVMPFPRGAMPFLSVLSKLRELPVKEVFCEVLNPKDDNIGRMVAVLNDYPEHAQALREYDSAKWAQVTYHILRLGMETVGAEGFNTLNFIPWPDTGRGWAKHLQPDQVAWLNKFLPEAV